MVDKVINMVREVEVNEEFSSAVGTIVMLSFVTSVMVTTVGQLV